MSLSLKELDLRTKLNRRFMLGVSSMSHLFDPPYYPNLPLLAICGVLRIIRGTDLTPLPPLPPYLLQNCFLNDIF